MKSCLNDLQFMEYIKGETYMEYKKGETYMEYKKGENCIN